MSTTTDSGTRHRTPRSPVCRVPGRWP